MEYIQNFQEITIKSIFFLQMPLKVFKFPENCGTGAKVEAENKEITISYQKLMNSAKCELTRKIENKQNS